MGSSCKVKNLLPGELNLLFLSLPTVRRELKIEMAELLPLNVYIFILMWSAVSFKHVQLP